MAKELAWKASRAERPRGFESHALRQKKKEHYVLLFLLLRKGMGLEPITKSPSTLITHFFARVFTKRTRAFYIYAVLLHQ